MKILHFFYSHFLSKTGYKAAPTLKPCRLPQILLFTDFAPQWGNLQYYCSNESCKSYKNRHQ